MTAARLAQDDDTLMTRTLRWRSITVALALPAVSLGAQVRATGFVGDIERLDPAIDALIPRDARIEKLADGFDWAEGPTWRAKGGYLVFSDVPKNTIYRWKDGEGLTVFLRPSGFIGPNPPGRELGSNGLTSSPTGALVMADHGNRQVASLDETKFTKTTLADRYRGKRLNSPNDLVFRSNGDLYFTDPPFGLKGLNDDPAKELTENGVYRVSTGGELTLLTQELRFPNGIAFSPDERTLYVSNAESAKPIWMAYDVQPDGCAGARSRVLRCDGARAPGSDRRPRRYARRQATAICSRRVPAGFSC